MSMRAAAHGADAQTKAAPEVDPLDHEEEAFPVRTEPIKVGVKLPPADYHKLLMFTVEASAATGKRVTHQGVLEALLDAMFDSPRLRTRVLKYLANTMR